MNRGVRIGLCLLLSLSMVTALTPLTGGFGSTVHGATGYAAPATAEQLERASKEFGITPSGGVFKIIDGKLYAWGSNAGYGLGVKQGDTANSSLSIFSPIEHDFFQEGSHGSVLKIMPGANNSVFAYTDQNMIFGWGSNTAKWVTLKDANKGVYPYALDTSSIPADRSIVEVNGNGTVVFARDSSDVWYVAGQKTHTTNSPRILTEFSDIDSTPPEKLLPIKSEFKSLGGSNVVKMLPYNTGAGSFLITEDNKVYVIGELVNMMFVNSTTPGSTTPVDIFALNPTLGGVMAGVDLTKALATNGSNSTMIDKTGSVWASGGNGSNCITTVSGRVGTATKVFDADKYQKKVVKTFISDNMICYLCNDNTLYATGKNANQFITTEKPSNAAITTPMQVAKEISEKETIVGVYPSDMGVTLLTKSGNLYFSGDNSRGTAGNGSNENSEPGKVEEVVPPDLPPVEPVTENKITYELEMADGSLVRTLPGNTDGTKLQLTSSKGAVFTTDSAVYRIRAGEPFKLNVYFTDFAKLNSFTVPIRFDPKTFMVVNGENEPYSTAKVMTPGKLGASVGIEQCFTNDQWQGGYLPSGGLQGTYPKISNGGGWVSISGATSTANAGISNSQKMFSIRFMAKSSNADLTGFSFADSSNAPVAGLDGYTGAMWDTASVGENGGACWSIASTSMDGFFNFAADPFPKFKTYQVPLTGFQLTILRNTGGQGTPVVTRESIEYGSVFGIDYRNTDATYTISVAPEPANASFPDADWEIELLSPTGGGISSGDYLSVLGQKGTYLNIKVPDGFDPETTSPGYLRIKAVNKKETDLSSQVTLGVQSIDPPTGLTIHAIDGGDVDPMIYHYKPTTSTKAALENHGFQVDLHFDDPERDRLNNQVVWKLLKRDGTEWDLSSAEVPLIFDRIQEPNHISNAALWVQPLKTTFGEDYVTLRAESAYDSSVYDEVKLKVQLYSTALEFPRDVIRIPVDTSRDMTSLLELEPQDVYATDLKWNRVGKPDGGPYLDISEDGRITTLSTPTPTTGGVDGAPLYERIQVTDQLSGETTTVSIQVLSLDSPIGISDIVPVNQVGNDGDKITVKNGVLPNDVIKIYPTYESTVAAITYTVPADFTAGSALELNLSYFCPDGLLQAGGGVFGFTVTRLAGDDVTTGAIKEFGMVPVEYKQEPSKVTGYIRLSGKEASNSRNVGIEVTLENAKHSETVKTTADGKFEFKEYIPPGNYSLIISQDKYLKRLIQADEITGYTGITIPRVANYAISTFEAPIYLYPGDLNGDGGINSKDITAYLQNWFGQTDTSITDFDKFDFYDEVGYRIGLYDLNMLLSRSGWLSSTYPQWVTPAQN